MTCLETYTHEKERAIRNVLLLLLVRHENEFLKEWPAEHVDCFKIKF